MSSHARPHPSSRPAIICAIIGLTTCAVVAWWRGSSADGTSAMPASTNTSVDRPAAAAVPDPLAGVPQVTKPVSSALQITADRTRDDTARLQALVDGGLPQIDQAQDIALMRRILRDPSEGDTIRNEAANLLGRSEAPDLVADLQAVLAHPAEEERFRSFAMQHLGVHWNQHGSPHGAPDHAALRTGLSDRHVAVRREALLALSRGGDVTVPDHVTRLLADPAAAGEHDLAIRLAADLRMTDLLPTLRTMLVGDRPETIRIAALDAVARLHDASSRPVLLVAQDDKNPRVAAAGRQALTTLDGALP